MIKRLFEKFKESRKEEIEEEITLYSILLQFISFSTIIIVMTLFYMGALSHQGSMSSEQYELNVTQSFDTVADAGVHVVMTFYENGRENPRAFTIIFWFTIFFWFYYPIKDIYKYIK